MRRIAEFVLRHRRLVGITWVVIVIVGIALTQKTNNRLVVDFSLPGQPGTQTANQIDHEFHAGGKTAPYIVTITLPAGASTAASGMPGASQPPWGEKAHNWNTHWFQP